MSMLGPYASWNKETGYAIWDHPAAEYTGIFERIDVGIKGIIHVGMWDFIEYGCYTKLVGNKVVGVEANPHVYNNMSKPVADKWGFKCFNEFLSEKDGEVKNFYLAGEGSSLYQGPPEWNKHTTIKVQTKTLSTVIEENNIDITEYDFLNIDAEGSELDILKGFEKYLQHINVIDLETSYDDRNRSGASHQAICNWLKERNFEIREMSPSYRTQGWGDSIFVRTNIDLPPFVDGNAGTNIYGKDYLELNWGK
jgi:FkbM family methyltransferase